MPEESFFTTRHARPERNKTAEDPASKEYPDLTNWIQDYKNRNSLNIIQKTPASRKDVFDLYKAHEVLIFPSYFESFGLPLLEAQQFGLSIIASELDFVRDSSEPLETFDPHSPTSIRRAVERYLKIKNTPLIQTPNEFIKNLLQQ